MPPARSAAGARGAAVILRCPPRGGAVWHVVPQIPPAQHPDRLVAAVIEAGDRLGVDGRAMLGGERGEGVGAHRSEQVAVQFHLRHRDEETAQAWGDRAADDR